MRRAAHAPFLSHRKEFAALVDKFLRGAEISRRQRCGPWLDATLRESRRRAKLPPSCKLLPVRPEMAPCAARRISTT